MKTVIFLIALAWASISNAAYTEFYVDPSHGSASNMNGGSSSGAPLCKGVSGGWNQSTRVFTFPVGTTGIDSSLIDHFASVNTDSTSIATSYIARVTAVNSGARTITLDATAKAGSAPITSSGNMTCTVGGCWAGLSTSSTFPFSLATLSACKNSSSNTARLNFKGTSFDVGTTSLAIQPDIIIEGYTSAPGDGGKAKITTACTTTNFVCNASGNLTLRNIWLKCTQTSSSATMLAASATNILVECVNCRFEESAGYCFSHGGTGVANFRRCEFISPGRYTVSPAGALTGQTTTTFVVEDCVFRGTFTAGSVALELSNTSGATVRRSAFSGCATAVTISPSATIEECAIYNCTLGVTTTSAISAGQVPAIRRCVFDTCTTAISAVTTTTGQRIRIENNGFWNCTTKYGANITQQESVLTNNIDFNYSPLVNPSGNDFRTRASQGRGTIDGSLLLTTGSTPRRLSIGLAPSDPWFN